MNVFDRIDNWIKSNNTSRRQLAIKSGISPSTLQSIMERRKTISLDVLIPISKTMGIPSEILLDPESQEAKDNSDRLFDNDLAFGQDVDFEGRLNEIGWNVTFCPGNGDSWLISNPELGLSFSLGFDDATELREWHNRLLDFMLREICRKKSGE